LRIPGLHKANKEEKVLDLLMDVPLKKGGLLRILLHVEVRVPRAWVQFKHKCLFGMPMLRKEAKCKSMPHLCCEGW
jgi:hypothetical protein